MTHRHAQPLSEIAGTQTFRTIGRVSIRLLKTIGGTLARCY